MPEFVDIRAVITDIEGTTSSISFVHDVLFPYAANHLPEWVKAHAREPAVAEQLGAVAEAASVSERDLDAQIEQLLTWIAQDVKATPLKALQGMIWEAGYRNRDFQAHVFSDVSPCLQAWKRAGLGLYVYSSGSVLAQKLFFEFSEAGNLLPLFDGHFDTTTGGKRERSSYEEIAQSVKVPPSALLFLSDVLEELVAAEAAGFQVCLLKRPGNGRVDSHTFPVATSFDQIRINNVTA